MCFVTNTCDIQTVRFSIVVIALPHLFYNLHIMDIKQKYFTTVIDMHKPSPY